VVESSKQIVVLQIVVVVDVVVVDDDDDSVAERGYFLGLDALELELVLLSEVS
jgi:hypothetical protein